MHTSFEDNEILGKFAGIERTPEVKVGMAIRAVVSAMDELIALANESETRALVCDEKIAIGQIWTRLETLTSFVMAVRPAPILVRNRSS